jgi:hypothetical protein
MATVAVRARCFFGAAADVAASDRALRDVDEDAATATREVSVAGYKAVGDANMTMKYVSMRPAVGIRRARACVDVCRRARVKVHTPQKNARIENTQIRGAFQTLMRTRVWHFFLNFF